LFCGAIILEGPIALLINCVELYARLSSFDAHFEPYTKDTLQSILSLFLSCADMRNKSVRAVISDDDKSRKLKIGTTMSNALVTFSVLLKSITVNISVAPITYGIY
jgi:hypothetical protein